MTIRSPSCVASGAADAIKTTNICEMKEIQTIFIDCGKAEHEERKSDDKKVVGEAGVICRWTFLARRILKRTVRILRVLR